MARVEYTGEFGTVVIEIDPVEVTSDLHLLCGETITPGLVGPSRMSATLDGEPITVERAMEIIQAAPA